MIPNDRLNHPVLMVSESRVKYNLDLFHEYSKGAEVAAVLKADAYGCGLENVAKMLFNMDITTFFVATQTEALEISKCLQSEVKIYILSDHWKPLRVENKAHIISVASTLEAVIELANIGTQEHCAIHLDLGLNRFGVKFQSIKDLIRKIKSRNSSGILVLSHLSHAAESKSAENKKQIARLLEVKKEFKDLTYSISGSAGIINSSSFNMDIVRAGISLFGATSTDSDRMKKFRNAVTLRVPILQSKNLKPGEGVGYFHKFVAKESVMLGTAKIGYADGINRALFDKDFYAFFKSCKCTIVGHISMDMINFIFHEESIKDAKNNNFDSDFIELINDIQTPDKIAKLLNTIPHEILTSLGSRVERRIVS